MNSLPQRRLIGITLCCAVALTACALPSGGNNRWADVDGKPHCKVLGGWDRYTWSGACESGYASGYGDLRGYGGSIEMLRFTGTLQGGLRDGNGTLWINNDHINGGPTLRTGLFKTGKFTTGTETNDTMEYVYVDGVQTSRHAISSPLARSSGSSEILAATLTGIAQAYANRRAAPTTSPQARPAPAVPSPASTYAAPTPPRGSMDSRQSAAPAQYIASTAPGNAASSSSPASHCLKLGRDQWNGLQFTNTCNQRVHFTYCHHGSSSNSFRCAGPSGGHYGKGSGSVSARGTARLPDSASASGAAWFGCAAVGGSTSSPIARLTSINPSEGNCH